MNVTDKFAADQRRLEDQALADRVRERHGLTVDQLAEIIGIRSGTLQGMLKTPGRKLSGAVRSMLLHLSGDQTLEERVDAIRRVG